MRISDWSSDVCSSDLVNTLLMIVALATMIVGVLGALAQAELKRILSFTLVSHIGYMVFGLAIATPIAIGATIYYTVHHIVVQTTLFLAIGLVERRAGRSEEHTSELQSLMRISYAVFCLKKQKTMQQQHNRRIHN